MELNREQIIKALECCIKNQCENCCQCGNWHEQWNCMTFLMKNALALIKELTQNSKVLLNSVKESLHAKEDKAACSVSIYDIDEVLEEVMKNV